jgi:hypothetical protein
MDSNKTRRSSQMLVLALVLTSGGVQVSGMNFAANEATTRSSRQDLTPIVQVECPADVTRFSRRLVLQMAHAEDLQWLLSNTNDQLYTLETTVMATYNEMSFHSCDQPHFRTLSEVSRVDFDDWQEPFSTGQTAALTSSLVLEIEGSCRNCTEEIPLFGFTALQGAASEAARNETSSTNSSSNASSTAGNIYVPAVVASIARKENNGPPCMCPLPHSQYTSTSATSNSDPALSLSLPVFQDQLHENLRKQLDRPIRISSIYELQEVTCSPVVKNFTSFAYLDFNLGNASEPFPEELEALEEAFAQAYNRLSFQTCDPYFRRVLNAKVQLRMDPPNNTVTGLRQLQSYNSNGTVVTTWTGQADSSWESSQVNHTTEVSNVVFTITGQCHNCPVSTTGSFRLFDESFRRRRRSRRLAVEIIPNPFHWGDGFRHRDLQFVPDTCFCPSQGNGGGGDDEDDAHKNLNTTTIPPTISQDDFLVTLNQDIAKKQKEGTVMFVESAKALDERHQVECGEQQTTFKSEVFSDLRVDLLSIDPKQIKALEKAFLKSYRKVSFRSCDSYFRAISRVELRIAPPPKNGVGQSNYTSTRRLGGRSLQEVLDTMRNNSTMAGTSDAPNVNTTAEEVQRELLPTLFAVVGSCRDCPVSLSGQFKLFEDSFRRRRRQLNGAIVSPWSSSENPQISNDICTCPAGESPQEGLGPTADSFEDALIAEIASLEESGEIEAVEGTGKSILEGSRVNCNGEQQNFISYVYADLGVSASQISSSTKQRLEEVFLETYNDLSFRACDEFFRVVSSVGLMIKEDLGLERKLQQAERNATSVNSTDDTALASTTQIFWVKGRCRNCPVSPAGGFSLFDDALFRRRHLHINAPSFPFRRRTQEALDVCLCPQGKEPGEEPAPNIDDFLIEFNENILKAQAENEAMNEIDANGNAQTPAGIAIPAIRFREVVNPPNITLPPTSATASFRATHDSIGSETPQTATPSPVTRNTDIPISTTPSPTLRGSTQTNQASPQPSRRPTPQPSPQPSPEPTTQPTPQPTSNPTPSPTPKPTPRPSPRPSPIPTPNPTPQPFPRPITTLTPPPSPRPSPFPTSKPTPNPTEQPTPSPTLDPTFKPTVSPTHNPTSDPTPQPSVQSSASPSSQPTKLPCNETLLSFSDEFFLTLSGKNSSQLNETFLERVFAAGSDEISSSLSGCTPTLLNATVLSTIPHRLRRTLQDGVTVTVIYNLAFLSLNAWDIFLPVYLNPLETALNNYLDNVGFAVLGLGSMTPTLSPSLYPSPSPTTSQSTVPSATPTGTDPSPRPSFSPISLTPSTRPSSAPSTAPTLRASSAPNSTPSRIPTSLPSQPPSLFPTAVSSSQPSSSPSKPPSLRPSSTPSSSPSSNPSEPPSLLPSSKPSSNQSEEPSFLPSSKPSSNLSEEPSFLPSSKPSSKQSEEPSFLPSFKPSFNQSEEPSFLPSFKPSFNQSEEPSFLPSSKPSSNASEQPSLLPSSKPSSNASEQPSWLPSSEPSWNPSELPSVTPSSRPSFVRSSTPSEPPSLIPSDAPSAYPSFRPSQLPTSLPSNSPTFDSSSYPSFSPSLRPSQLPTLFPSRAPSLPPSTLPSKLPSLLPSSRPSFTPAELPSALPSDAPSTNPSVSPSWVPSPRPSKAPTLYPSGSPSSVPTLYPSGSPSSVPTLYPSSSPSSIPSFPPSQSPTSSPSILPSSRPSLYPSAFPSHLPSLAPSGVPSTLPSITPSNLPSFMPSTSPSDKPSSLPSVVPSMTPTTPGEYINASIYYVLPINSLNFNFAPILFVIYPK